MQHRGITIPETIPGRASTRFPRRVAWSLVRPYFDSMLRQLVDENAALRSDLIATNNRISWLEEQREAKHGASA